MIWLVVYTTVPPWPSWPYMLIGFPFLATVFLSLQSLPGFPFLAAGFLAFQCLLGFPSLIVVFLAFQYPPRFLFLAAIFLTVHSLFPGEIF